MELCVLMLFYATFSPDITKINATAPWELYVSFNFITYNFPFFWQHPLSTWNCKTDAAQRLSYPHSSSLAHFNEQFSVLK
jgi:hypothetical protein